MVTMMTQSLGSFLWSLLVGSESLSGGLKGAEVTSLIPGVLGYSVWAIRATEAITLSLLTLAYETLNKTDWRESRWKAL